jgi:hypothetical protein
VLFILLYDCVGLVSGFIDVEQASMGIKQQRSDLDSKWTKWVQLHANKQIQSSSINDMEASCIMPYRGGDTGRALHNVEVRREQGGQRLHTHQGGEDDQSLKYELTGNGGAVTSLLNLKKETLKKINILLGRIDIGLMSSNPRN